MIPTKKIVVATHNAHKVAEIKAILAMPGWEFLTLDELGIAEEPVEDAGTFEGNARIKARFAHEKTGLAALADDSGLAVDALDGAPGVYSSRYAGDAANDTANNTKLLQELEAFPGPLERAAEFICALVFIDEDGSETVAEGAFCGRIGFEPAGANGFGYDPLFLAECCNYEYTSAEMSAEEKNSVSHRYKALENLRAQLLDMHLTCDSGKANSLTAGSSDGDGDGDGSEGSSNGGGANAEDSSNEISSSKTSPASTLKEIVAFDFDGTLISVSSPVRLISRLNSNHIMSKGAVFKSMLWGLWYKMGMELDQAKPRRYVFSSFKTFPVSEADSIMKQVYYEKLKPRLRPQALATLKEHLAAGRHVIIVSASFEPIIKELCLDLGIEDYICTQMEVAEGSYTGETLGTPPESKEKLIQFTAWANKKFGIGTWELTHAYGDHFSDVPLIETARHPVVIDPDHRLKGIAKERGWEVHDWPLTP